jgi:hypothetical protein
MRTRLRRRAVLTAALACAGVAAATGVAAPAAAAAATPTISAPATTTGYSTITITGHAAAGATVELYEAAYKWAADMNPALNWEDGTFHPITATAAADGTYVIRRWVDTGFVFAVKADGVMSPTVLVHVRLLPILSVTSTKAGTVTARVSATPQQPYLPVQIQRANTNGTWSIIARGHTGNAGTYAVTVGKQPSGRSYTYRAWVGSDPETALLSATSAIHRIRIK